MAVFMINICKFNGCGITFPSLGDLIQHIEDTHIDYDPMVIEQKEASQPSCIPLSYVLRFFTEASRREFQKMAPAPANDVRRRLLPPPPKAPSLRSNTPTGSELDEEDMMSPSEDSNDSWTTVDEYSSEYILRYGVKINGSTASSVVPQQSVDKPFACPVPGCKKRYKNVNGIKYHSKNGHKKDGKVKKGFKCHCGKSYKTAQGLKTHSACVHSGPNLSTVVSEEPVKSALNKNPPLVVTSSNPRPYHLLDSDGHKLVRIYDSIQPKDLSSFTIPKHNLTNTVKNIEHTAFRHTTSFLTPSTTPESSPIDKKYVTDRSPKVTVQSAQSAFPPLTSISVNERMYTPKI